jgi:hypothetical protein
MSRAYTKEETRQHLLEHMRVLVDYWNDPQVKRDTIKERLSGLAFSILNIFDGNTALPAFNIALSPHDDDKQYHIDEGSNYYEPGMVINDDCCLHDSWYRDSGSAGGSHANKE